LNPKGEGTMQISLLVGGFRRAGLAAAMLLLAVAGLPAQPAASGRGGRGEAAATGEAGQRGAARGQGARRGGTRGPQIAAPQLIAKRDAQPYAPENFDSRKPGLPTLIMAGDSTAPTGPDAWHRGWFAPINDYFDTDKINLVNRARGGRSFRSFYHEGLWDELVKNINPGDIVLIQFGHNDGGDVKSPNGRPDLVGMGDETQDVVRTAQDGTTSTETVHTFGWYARKYVQDVKAKGGKPVLLSVTVWGAFGADGNVTRPKNDGRLGNNMYKWIRQIAKEENVPWLDAGNAIADSFQKLGRDGIRPFFQADSLHTTTFGAINNCEALIGAIKAMSELGLEQYLNEAGKAIPAWAPSAAALATEKEMQP
jgi:lysophospholipase L1-like esterase